MTVITHLVEEDCSRRRRTAAEGGGLQQKEEDCSRRRRTAAEGGGLQQKRGRYAVWRASENLGPGQLTPT